MTRRKMKAFSLVVAVFIFLNLFFVPVQAAPPSATLLISPQSGAFTLGSTFDVSLFLDTGGANVNTIDVELRFPADLLQVAEVSTGISIFSQWPIPPELSNTEGKVRFRGGINPGIVTSQGLISTLTFRAKGTGSAALEFSSDAKVLANDGTGNDILTARNEARFDILPALARGPIVTSPTHINFEVFHKNNTIVFTWNQEQGVEGYSYSFNSNPVDVPDNLIDTSEGSIQFTDVQNGVWYFHIKQVKNSFWSTTSLIQIRIDDAPPEQFRPVLERSGILGRATLLTFETRDLLSGIDHYEIAVLSGDSGGDASPVFFETKSPYRLSDTVLANMSDIAFVIRAFDKAGNIRDETIREPLQSSWRFILKTQLPWIGIVTLLIGAGVFHFIFQHRKRVAAAPRNAFALYRNDDQSPGP